MKEFFENNKYICMIHKVFTHRYIILWLILLMYIAQFIPWSVVKNVVEGILWFFALIVILIRLAKRIIRHFYH